MRATANPKVKQYTDARTGKPRYLVKYRKPDGRQSTKRGFTTKRDAEAWLIDVEGAKQRGEFVAVSAGRVPLSTIAGPWLEAKAASVKRSTMDGIEGAWEHHVKPEFGDVPLYRIRHSDVEAWVGRLAQRRSPTVVRRAHACLAQMLDSAVRDRRLVVNPARDVSLPRVRSSAHRYLSHMEVKAVADQAGDKAPLVYLLAYGGLRWGEAVALRGSDVTGNRVRVDRAVTATKHGWKVGTPKTHERRTLYLPGFVTRLLPVRDGLLFPPVRGEYLRTPSKVSRLGQRRQWWQAALEAAGVEYLTIHDLRHTAASLSVQSGAHVKAVQKMLGHKSAAMTLDVYSDLWDSDLEAVAGSMEAARDHDLTTRGGDNAGSRRDDAGTVGTGGDVVPMRSAR
jgi:integrase